MNQDLGARVLAAKGDPAAINELIKEYQPFIASETSKVCKRQVEYGVDDELSIAMLAFHVAANTYDTDKSSFLHYASRVIRNRILDYLRKENKHSGNISISEEGEGRRALESTLATEDYTEGEGLLAAQQEIADLETEMSSFGITFKDLADTRPKQKRTVSACGLMAGWAAENADLVSEMKRSKKLPIAQICDYTGLERKTIERHRKYIIAIILIYSNGYEIIRGHMKQVLVVRKGGGQT